MFLSLMLELGIGCASWMGGWMDGWINACNSSVPLNSYICLFNVAVSIE